MTTISGTSSASSAWSDTSTQRSGRHRGGMDAAKLFAKVDADGSGSVDSSELQTMLDKMAKRSGQASTTTAADAMTKMDRNGDGKLDKDELAAGMKSLMPPPSSTMDFAQRREGAGGPPPGGPPPGGPPPTSSASGSTDPLDTNGDGIVSAEEKAAGASGTSSTDGLAALFKAIDTDGDSKLSSSEFSAFADKLGTALSQAASGSGSGSGSSDGQDTSDRKSGFDINAFASMVMRQYTGMSSADSAIQGQTLSVAA